MNTIKMASAPVRPTWSEGRILRFLSHFSRDKFATVALVIFSALILSSAFADLVAPHDPLQQNLLNRLKPPVWVEGGSWKYILGTDLLGRDILSRCIHGGRMSLGIGVAVIAMGGVFGSLMGLLSGYLGGRFDAILMRYIDFQISVPYFLLALTIMAAIGTGNLELDNRPFDWQLAFVCPICALNHDVTEKPGVYRSGPRSRRERDLDHDKTRDAEYSFPAGDTYNSRTVPNSADRSQFELPGNGCKAAHSCVGVNGSGGS